MKWRTSTSAITAREPQHPQKSRRLRNRTRSPTAKPGGHGLAGLAVADVSTLILAESVGYSREKERQADRDGIIAMTAAATILTPQPLPSNSSTRTEPRIQANPTFYRSSPAVERGDQIDIPRTSPIFTGRTANGVRAGYLASNQLNHCLQR